MPRALRNDVAGAFFHVGNRGVDGCTIYRNEKDFRRFLALLAAAVRRKWFELHALCLMTNHFHLIVRSTGWLSEAMHFVQHVYSKYFNAEVGRTGRLMGSRFWSSQLRDISHRRNALHYVHENPVAAGICRVPAEYRWSTAWYVSENCVPKWWNPGLVRHFGVSRVRVRSERDSLEIRARANWMELRTGMEHAKPGTPLPGGSYETTCAWLRDRSRSPNGGHQFLPEIGPIALRASVDAFARSRTAVVRRGRRSRSIEERDLVLAGLLREVASQSVRSISELLLATPAVVRRMLDSHRQHLREDDDYAMQAALLLTKARQLVDPPE